MRIAVCILRGEWDLETQKLTEFSFEEVADLLSAKLRKIEDEWCGERTMPLAYKVLENHLSFSSSKPTPTLKEILSEHAVFLKKEVVEVVRIGKEVENITKGGLITVWDAMRLFEKE